MSNLADRISLAAILSGTMVLAGCADLNPFSRNKTHVVPGLVPPVERIEALGKMEKKIGSAAAAEQQGASAQLAAEFGREEDPMIRVAIVRVLGRCQTATAANTLRSAASDSAREVRVAVCETWAERGGAEAVMQLSEVLGSDLDVDVRLAAAKGLGETGDPAAVPALGLALESNDPAMRYRATQSLRSCAEVDFGGDVKRWQRYVRGESPPDREPTSVADRFRLPF